MNRAPILLGSLMLVGCSKTAKLDAKAKQTNGGVDVTVTVSQPASGTLTFSGLPAFEKLGPQAVTMGDPLVVTVKVPGIPLGKNTVTMHFEGKGKGLAKKVTADGSFTFDRVAAVPEVRLSDEPKPSATEKVECTGCGIIGLPLGADGKLSVSVQNGDGCVLDVGGQKIAVKGDPFPTTIDAINLVANAPLSPTMTALSDVKSTYKATRGPDTGDIELTGAAPKFLTPVLRRVTQVPLTIAGEVPKAATAPKSAVLVRSDAGLFFRVVGSPAKVRDVDLVGVATVTTKKLPSCGTYEGTTTGKQITVDHDGETYDLAVHDRRSGKLVARRTFPFEDKGCASRLVGRKVVSTPNDEQIVAWTRSLLR